jgi:hypothetical protein
MYLTSSVELSIPITLRSLAAAGGLLITFNSEIRVPTCLAVTLVFLSELSEAESHFPASTMKRSKH